MDKGDTKRIEDKLDKQTEMLTTMKIQLVEEVSLLKLAHQKIKHQMVMLSAITLVIVAVEYPKLMKILKGII